MTVPAPTAISPPADDNATMPGGLCPVCWTPFPPTGRRVFCGDPCRKTAWRRRHRDRPRPTAPIPAGTPRREATVYECDDCGTRFHGQQWCGDCNRPCRRIGLGGTCPNCDEPIAVSDLFDTPTEVPHSLTNPC